MWRVGFAGVTQGSVRLRVGVAWQSANTTILDIGQAVLKYRATHLPQLYVLP